ncbi:MAG TPA: class I SAM-dependent methyltransferase [Aggregatilineaceae bacterium]|nr:class I SAM-dependent methyltransferase [Aggregatilineaceae bacterium]
MYNQSAQFYDLVYGYKDYAGEAQAIHKLITQYCRSGGNVLLDVACGTGRHLDYLQEFYAVSGLDLSAELLTVARQRLPGATFYEADMVDFDLGVQFDVIICLFSAIGYVQTDPCLWQTVQGMSRHLKPGGVVIVEPWFTPEQWHPGTAHATFVDQPELKVARMTVSEQEGSLSRNDFHWLVATPAGIQYFTERHELGLFTQDAYMSALREAELDVIFDPDGLTGRGLYIGVKPM